MLEKPCILRSEVEDVIRKLKFNKAPGPDLVASEVLKGLGENGITCLHKICYRIWNRCNCPSDKLTLAFFGNVARRTTDNLERLIVTEKMHGKRPRGRNPKRWADQKPEHLEIPASVELYQATQRARWKLLTQKLWSHDPQQ
ncbi:endonuclease-reverse transcriptase [Danaus plexippus plexippus]|uniref:Endonuclease-reverse transcriptase n=1 Tax=Danaus plexippus plexippus TaxID=278856 RepID=A0A212F3L8_DANPL|nr:endonuclease-reverse transcriptase [Danaus plexippus plexippus]